MKTITILAINFLFFFSYGQQIDQVYVNENVSTHFVSSQKLDYTDISTSNVVGDMPLDNILRIKPIKNLNKDLGYVTIVGEDFFKQFKLVYTTNSDNASKQINLGSKDFKNPNYSLTSEELEKYATLMQGVKPSLNNVYSKK